jgi:chromosome segregation ATPase
MEKQTKKMAEIKDKIKSVVEERGVIGTRLDAIRKARVESEKGKKASEDALKTLTTRNEQLAAEIGILRAELEVAEVEMAAGIDTDFVEPTPADALRDAS